jgi:hypothetical protein
MTNTRIRIYVSFLFSSSTSEEPLQMGKKKPKNTILASLIYSCRRKDSCFSPLKSSFLAQPSSKRRILQPKTRSSFGQSTTRHRSAKFHPSVQNRSTLQFIYHHHLAALSNYGNNVQECQYLRGESAIYKSRSMNGENCETTWFMEWSNHILTQNQMISRHL